MGLAALTLLAPLASLSATETTEDLSGLLADLPGEELTAYKASLEADPLPDDPGAVLGRIIQLEPSYRFDGGLVVVDADRRWFSARPQGGPGSAILEVRRWPGDTVLSFYVLRGSEPADGYEPPLSEASLEGPVVNEDLWWWEGTLDTRSGERRVVWLERAVEGGAGRLGVLMVPGDAGLGTASILQREIEARFVLGGIQVRDEAWAELGSEVVEGNVRVPELGLAPRAWDEREDTWQIARGIGFTLGLPPGVHGMRLTPTFPGPRPIDGGAMWFRGRFVDSRGETVIVGDEQRGGFVVEIQDPDEDWLAGKRPPAAAPMAVPKAGVDFELATDRTGATSARAERWQEKGFDGEWLVFRLGIGALGIEIDIPVLAGRQSEALYWIPVSWRPATSAPAPPPVDPASRFGIRFVKLRPAEQSHQPWTEGYLTAPGLRLELPLGWWPVASLRSENGYPIRIIDLKGLTTGWLLRVEPGDPVLEPGEGQGWLAVNRPKRFRAAAVYQRDDGSRIYVAREGHGFVIRRESNTTIEPAEWERLIDSVSLLK